MCGIIGSFDKGKLDELADLNKARGNKCFSITGLSFDKGSIEITKQNGVYETEHLDEFPEYDYYILHIQSPTGTTFDIHPANNDTRNYYLWHNGMLLNDEIKRYKTELGYTPDTDAWDTQLLLELLIKEDELNFDALNKIKGSFACIFLDSENEDLYLFRNNIVPIHIDDELNISSNKFPNSDLIPSNIIYEINVTNKKLIERDKIDNQHNPYLF